MIAFLAPIYFVTSGMAVDIPGLRAGDLGDFVLILTAACAGKFLGAFAGARVAGIGARDSVGRRSADEHPRADRDRAADRRART